MKGFMAVAAVVLRKGGLSTLTPLLIYSVVLNVILAMPGNLAYALRPYLDEEARYIFISGRIAPANPGGFACLLARSMYMFNLSILLIILATSIIYVAVNHRSIALELRSLVHSLERAGVPRYQCILFNYLFLVTYYTVLSSAIYILVGGVLSYLITVFASAPYIPATINMRQLALVSLYFAATLLTANVLVIRS